MRNNSHYSDLTVPVTDRHLRLLNTSVQWWKVDVIEGFDLTAADIVFSEMMVKEDSVAYLTNSICEGQTIHLGSPSASPVPPSFCNKQDLPQTS